MPKLGEKVFSSRETGTRIFC